MGPTGGGLAIAPTLENLDRVRNSQVLQTGAAVHKRDRILEIKVVRVEQIDESSPESLMQITPKSGVK